MSDPLPRRLIPYRSKVGVNYQWQRAVQDAISKMQREASKPMAGVLSGNSNAVLFADEAELLACLVLDISQGLAWQRWWWRTFLSSASGSANRSAHIRDALCERAIYTPSALSCLCEWRRVDSVVNTLSGEDIFSVLSAIGDAFGMETFVHELLAVQYEREDLSASCNERFPPFQQECHDQPDVSENTIAVDLPGENARNAPWDGLIAQRLIPSGVAKEQRLLLGIALTLQSAPQALRSRTFQKAVLHWWRTEKSYSQKGNDSQRGNGFFASTKTRHSRIPPSEATPEGDHDALAVRAETFIIEDSNISESGVAREAVIGLTPETRIHKTKEVAEINLGREILNSRQRTSPDIGQQGRTPASESTFAVEFPCSGVHTRLAGVFYLINLMRHLKLPDCFESDWQMASRLGSWATLETLARALLFTCGDRALDEDSLWSLLSHLDNRQSGELPGGNLNPLDSYRIPDHWWKSFPASDKPGFFWAIRRRRLRIWSNLGFLLIDTPSGAHASEKDIRKAIEHYIKAGECGEIRRRSYDAAPVARIDGSWKVPLYSALLDGLALLLPYVRAYLDRVLYPQSPGSSGLVQSVLECPGVVYVTTSHVDLVMSMDDISLPIRLAGLDRDPGWMADFGRVIQFHYD